MAIRANATQSGLFLANDRPESLPLLTFNGFGPTLSHTTILWCKVSSPGPAQILTHTATNGSLTYFSFNGESWVFSARNGTGATVTYGVAPPFLNRWLVFVYVLINGNDHRIYMGAETGSGLVEINPSPILQIDFAIEGEHSYIVPIVNPHVSICNFKFFHQALTVPQAQIHANTWMPEGDASVGLPLPVWASPLRVPGDLSGIANRNALGNWNHNYAYSGIQAPENIAFDPVDPEYLSTQKCVSWLYPRLAGTVTVQYPNNTFSGVNPVNTPAVDTFYDGTPLHRLEDRGTLPATAYIAHLFQALPGVTGPGVQGPTESWALYIDHNGNRVGDTVDARFNLITGAAAIPPPITIDTIYAWKFGGQFKYPGRTPAVSTINGFIAHLVVYVTYIGKPTGLVQLPLVDFAGLFIIDETAPLVDQYNGTTLKIPDPTIRTAYIGE